MPSVDDVAAAVLDRTGTIDTYKLQKLVYYCQAWHLAWEGKPLFQARVEAWANGPVVPKLYREHRGMLQVKGWPSGDGTNLAPDEVSTVESVVSFYNKYSGWELAQLTHKERPWAAARAKAGLGPGDRGSVEITQADMAEYYSSLTP